jgi:hypothetical protein
MTDITKIAKEIATHVTEGKDLTTLLIRFNDELKSTLVEAYNDGDIEGEAAIAIAENVGRIRYVLDKLPDWNSQLDIRLAEVLRELNELISSPGYGPQIHQIVKNLDNWSPADIDENLNNQIYTGINFVNGDSVGLHHYIENGPCDNLLIMDCTFMNHHKWASRSYRMRSNNKFLNCRFSNVLTEHAIYHNIAGYNGIVDITTPSFVVDGCLFEDIGSQAIQLVQRAMEQGIDCAALGDCTHGGPIIIRNTLFRNIGWNLGGNARASYALSLFDCTNEAYISNITVDNSLQRESRGALLLQNSVNAVVENSSFILGNNDRPIIECANVQKLTIQNCHFESLGNNALNIHGCGQVDIVNCTGNAAIYYKKTYLQDLSTPYHYETPA